MLNIKVLKPSGKQLKGGIFLRSENDVRKQLDVLRKDMMSGLPYNEMKSIAWHGTKQALEWVLEEAETCLTY
jgi:hypothetical protein